MQTTSEKATITCTISLPTERVIDLIITALEGGSNYWYWIEEDINVPSGMAYSEAFAETALTTGVNVNDLENPNEVLGRITIDSIRNAVAIIAEKYPWHFGNLFGDYDAETADVFFQVAVMGDIVFG
jgi:hypothetical protein